MQAPLLDRQSTTLECPKCGKHSIVSHQAGVYRCLNCDFERDLSFDDGEADAEGGLGKLISACAGFIITFAILL